jgi:hyperosmotically inducible periplasmic protein
MRFRTFVAMGAGGAIVWFFDPQQGRRRRAMTRDKVMSTRRRATEAKGRALRYQAGVEAGIEARARGAGQYHAHSYTDLREHLRGELHRLGLHDVNVDVDEDRRVTLRGEIDDRQHGDMLASLASTSGIGELIDLTHRPGQVAPNKAAAVAASANLPHRG